MTRAVHLFGKAAAAIGLLLALFAAPVAFFHYVMEGPKEPAP